MRFLTMSGIIILVLSACASAQTRPCNDPAAFWTTYLPDYNYFPQLLVSGTLTVTHTNPDGSTNQSTSPSSQVITFLDPRDMVQKVISGVLGDSLFRVCDNGALPANTASNLVQQSIFLDTITINTDGAGGMTITMDGHNNVPTGDCPAQCFIDTIHHVKTYHYSILTGAYAISHVLDRRMLSKDPISGVTTDVVLHQEGKALSSDPGFAPWSMIGPDEIRIRDQPAGQWFAAWLSGVVDRTSDGLPPDVLVRKTFGPYISPSGSSLPYNLIPPPSTCMVDTSPCVSEFIGFTDRHPPVLVANIPWTAAADSLPVEFPPETSVPIKIWILIRPDPKLGNRIGWKKLKQV